AEGRVRVDRGRRPGQAEGEDPARRAPRLLRRDRHPGAAGQPRDRAAPSRPPLRPRRRHGRRRSRVSPAHRVSLKILVLEGITDRGMEVLKAEGWTVDVRKAMPTAELAAMVAPYHAMMIRSGTQVTAQVLDAAQSLRIVGRPGVGVDNVDLEAATRRGVVVMNSPAGNIASTAELTLALLLAVARNIAQADAAMKAGRWDRKAF